MDDSRGFLDKAKAAMSQAASKAKEEVEDLQLRRDLGQAQRELGSRAFELIESGELEHPALEEHAARIRALRERLQSEGPAEPEPDAETSVPDDSAAD